MSNLFVNHILPAEYQDLVAYFEHIRVDNLFLYCPDDFYKKVTKDNEKDKIRLKNCIERFLIKYMKKPPVYLDKHNVEKVNNEKDKKIEQIGKLKLDSIDDDDLDYFLNNLV
jgi:hypothetical protein